MEGAPLSLTKGGRRPSGPRCESGGPDGAPAPCGPSDGPSNGPSEGTADMFAEPLVDGWTEDGLLAEVTLAEGFDLAASVEHLRDVTSNKVYRVTDPWKEQKCLICLDANLSPDTARALSLTRDDLFICRDSALDDTLAANLALQCNLKVI